MCTTNVAELYLVSVCLDACHAAIQAILISLEVLIGNPSNCMQQWRVDLNTADHNMMLDERCPCPLSSVQDMADLNLPTIHTMENKKMLELLVGISGAFRPGVLTALMGVSGAGKTTLMDVLAGRKTGAFSVLILHLSRTAGPYDINRIADCTIMPIYSSDDKLRGIFACHMLLQITGKLTWSMW